MNTGDTQHRRHRGFGCSHSESVQAQISGVVFDSLVFGHRELVRWGQLVEENIHDGAALDAVFSAYRFDAVMHFAALPYVGELVTAPGRYYDLPR